MKMNHHKMMILAKKVKSVLYQIKYISFKTEKNKNFS